MPYDRTLLSKVLAVGDANKLSLRNSDFFDSADIEYHLGYKVDSIDRDSKSVRLENGDRVSYDKLLLATGGRARQVRNPGFESKGLHLLRTGEDQLAIKAAAAKANNIVVMGGGFIGSECTSSLAKTYKGKVSMVCEQNVPMEHIYGYEVGNMLLNEHTKNGAKVYTNKDLAKVSYKSDSNGHVKAVVLANGYEIPADLVVIGAGIELNTELAKQAGLKMDANGGVNVNPFLQTSD